MLHGIEFHFILCSSENEIDFKANTRANIAV